MTVRFITSWNGYSAGDRATLAGATETALIAGGIARADYVQDGASPLYPPNRNDAAAVVGAAGAPFSTGLWQGCCEQAWQTAFGGYVWRLALELPCHARAFRIAFPKAQQGTWTVDGIAVCAADTAASPARFDPGAGAAWVTGTIYGVTAAKTIPQMVAPNEYQTNCLGDMVWSDWIFCATIPRVDTPGENPIVVVSVYSASVNTMAVNGGSGSENGFGSAPLARWVAFKSGASATVSFASGTSNPQCSPVLLVEFIPTVDAISIAAFGDSIMQGAKTSPPSRGYVIKAAATMQAASGYAVSSVNSGKGGDKLISAYNRFKMLVNSGGALPNIALFCPYSRNSVSSMSRAQMQGVAEAFIKLARQNGVLPALVTAIPESATPSNNAIATDMNVIARNMADYYRIPLIDNAAIITMANAATFLDADGIHPNSTGDDALGVNAGNTLVPWIPRAFTVAP